MTILFAFVVFDILHNVTVPVVLYHYNWVIIIKIYYNVIGSHYKLNLLPDHLGLLDYRSLHTPQS